MNPSLCVYGMRLRGFSPGCQPMSGLVRCMDSEDKKSFLTAERYHDVLLYSRQLTAEECRDYELDFLGLVAFLAN